MLIHLLKNTGILGNFLAVQWLRLGDFTARPTSIAMQPKKKKKKSPQILHNLINATKQY